MLWAGLKTTASTVVLALTALVPQVETRKTTACPSTCTNTSPADWDIYASWSSLSTCDRSIIFDLAIHTAVDDTSKTILIRACTATDSSMSGTIGASSFASSVYECSSSNQSSATLQLSWSGATSVNGTQNALGPLAQLQTYLSSAQECAKSIMFGHDGGVVVGIYGGVALDKDTTSSILDQVASEIQSNGASSGFIAQICGSDRDADHTFGVVVSTGSDLATAQAALASWSNGSCATGFATFSTQTVNISEHPQLRRNSNSTLSASSAALSTHTVTSAHATGALTTAATTASLNSTVESRNGTYLHRRSSVSARDDDTDDEYCTTQTVVSGDTCWSLSEACGISLDDFYSYNDDGASCGDLQIGQKVCCSSGSLVPLPYANGTCYTYTVESGDTCYSIGLPWTLSSDDVANLNDNTTWGWNGCSDLTVGLKICLSNGTVPMPASLSNAACGPQVPNTTFTGTITDASDLAALNPCPLNACCDIWGQCGIDPTFCTKSVGVTGNPGTAADGSYGCISNCGTEIVNNDVAPSEFKRLGYYEAFNWDRPCLNLRSEWANTDSYTHLHWGFGVITDGFELYINDTYSQWEDFMALENVKKIATFGGWSFSTDPSTYSVFRDAVLEENRDTFVANVVAFVENTGVDGVDFDWEYPGEPDISGIPADSDDSPDNFLATLTALRAALDDDVTISICAPASYWYLRPYPIADISEVVDYIVLMAYDLHGQWDYGDAYSQSGCAGGNCLRSHVNLTEVEYGLAMITKAGVSSTKIMVGESSYGRSFAMSTAGCTSAECTFTGAYEVSDATVGRCTDTAGYLANAEIQEIMDGSTDYTYWHDDVTASDYLVYDTLQWVAYMNSTTKATRRAKWADLNFAGTIDWAVDLQEFGNSDVVGASGDYSSDGVYNNYDSMIWNWNNPAIAAATNATNLIAPSPLPTVVTLTAFTTITLVSGDSYSTEFLTTVFSISEVSYEPFTIDATDVESSSVVTYYPVPRVTPEPAQITVPSGWTVTSSGGYMDADSAASSSAANIIGLGSSSTTITTTTTTAAAGAWLAFITWEPTISYSLPSAVTVKTPRPATIPGDEDSPEPTPTPGVTDCTGDSCTSGQDCTDDTCTRGGDCTGSACTRGGDCTGANCVRGGYCIGDACEQGGDCSGSSCVEGGGCSGAGCTKGGDCEGDACSSGGGCVSTLFTSCSSGDCSGLGCIDCTDMWCINPITISVTIPSDDAKATPSPTCISNCATLPACSGGDSSCNSPCNLDGCPASKQPIQPDCTSYTTVSDCTYIVSSTAVVTSPTTSYSTTTRTACETSIGCDALAFSVTTTMTGTGTADPLATVTGWYETVATDGLADGAWATLSAYYEEFETEDDVSATRSTTTIYSTVTITPTTTTTVIVSATPYADCELWDAGLAYELEVYNIQNWATDGGAELKDQEEGCGALTGWDWVDANDDEYAHVWFYLPIFIASGCVERAIKSAGGPSISCEGGGFAKKSRRDRSPGLGGRGFDAVTNTTLTNTTISSTAAATSFPVESTTATVYVGGYTETVMVDATETVQGTTPTIRPMSNDTYASLVAVYGEPDGESHTYTPMIWSTTIATTSATATVV